MDHVNKHSHHHGVFLRFGTLHDYFSALHSEDIRFTHEGARDFFPYADNIESFWTGYFSSKPVLKRAARAAERFLRASEMLLTRVALTTRNEETNGIPAWYTLLEDYRQATAQIQHHDGITGTSTEHVSQVYLDDLDNAWAKLSKTVEEEVLKLAPFKSIDDKMTIDAERSMLTKLGHGYGISMMMTNSLAFSVDTVHVVGMRILSR